MTYKRLKGTARQYVDTETGEKISRYERDKRIGELFNSGFRSYGQRKDSLDVIREYDTKTGEQATIFKFHGVTDVSKAADYFIKQNVASDTAFYSFRIKTKEGKWLSAKTGDMNSAAGYAGALLAKYELDIDDIEDIEVVVLD
jgi:hypothetical protein